MKTTTKKFIILLAGVALFDLLFWKEQAGLNYICFAIPLLIALYGFYPEARKSKLILITGSCIILSGVLITVNNSFINVFALFISFVLLTGFLNQSGIRSVLIALPTGLTNFLFAQITFFKSGLELSPFKSNLPGMGRYIKLSIIPIAVFILFFVIYQSANPIFKAFSEDLLQRISYWIDQFVENISISRILFLVFGAFLIIGILFDGAVKAFAVWESRRNDYLTAQWTNDLPKVLKRGASFSLNDEYTMGIILMGLLNLLLLVVNVIDVKWQWFGFKYEPGMDLSQLVHEGTYLLILSIVLAMAIIFYFFRANLNFIPDNNKLKWLAYLWIIQNLILVISVAIRNCHYIHYFGLTNKRIGVVVFLAMTVIGLFTLAIKIERKKSTYYLFRVNSWAALAVMMALSLFNWDMIIARHNINHPSPQNIDVQYLISLSDKTLPLLDQHRELFDREAFYSYSGSLTYLEMLDSRIESFISRKKEDSWPSWNYAEYKAMQYFLNKENPTL